jgi:hypothetical protein
MAPEPSRSYPSVPMTDSAGQKLAYVYFEDEPGRRSAAKLLTKDRRNPPRLASEQLRQLGNIR